MFELLGDGFTLLAFDVADQVVSRFKAAADALAVPLTVIRDSYAGEREAYCARLILVRPDQFVAWSGNEFHDDAAEVIGKAIGTPQSVMQSV